MITITYEWKDPNTLIQVPYTRTEPTVNEAFEFLKALLYSAIITHHQYSHLTISKHS